MRGREPRIRLNRIISTLCVVTTGSGRLSGLHGLHLRGSTLARTKIRSTPMSNKQRHNTACAFCPNTQISRYRLSAPWWVRDQHAFAHETWTRTQNWAGSPHQTCLLQIAATELCVRCHRNRRAHFFKTSAQDSAGESSCRGVCND